MILKTKWLVICLALFQLVGCSNPIFVNKTDTQAQDEVGWFVKKMNLNFTNKTEQHIISESLYDYFYYIRQKYGLEKWRVLLKETEKKSLSESIIGIYNKTLYQMGTEMINNLLAKEEDRIENLVSIDFDVFKIYYNSGSDIEKDIESIRYLLNRYYRGISEFVLTDKKITENFNKNLNNLNENKIIVYLLNNEALIKKYNLQYRGETAAVQYYYSLKQGYYLPHLELIIKYNSILSAYVLVHELTHIIYALSTINPDQALRYDASLTGSLEKAKQTANTLKIEGGGMLGEGFAEYVTEKFNIFYKYKILGDVDIDVKCYSEKNNFKINIASLPQEIRSPDINKRVFSYQIAHSLCRYIIAKYSKEKFIELLNTSQQNEDYKKILGIDIEQLNQEWNEYIKNKEVDS